jgi:hypothetical protein
LTSWENTGFLWRTVLRGISWNLNGCYGIQLQNVTLNTSPLARSMQASFTCNILYLSCTAVICFSFTWDCQCSLTGTNLGFIYYVTDSQTWYIQLLHSWVNRISTFFKSDLWYFQITYWSRYSVMATTPPPPPPVSKTQLSVHNGVLFCFMSYSSTFPVKVTVFSYGFKEMPWNSAWILF